MIILGVDPGGTTGIAVIETNGLRLVDSRQLTQTDTVTYLYDLLVRRSLTYGVDQVAIERFTIAGRTLVRSRQTTALELIGVTKAMCQIAGVPATLQAPADAKNVWSDRRLQTTGIAAFGKHSRDALRHALLLAQRCGTIKDVAQTVPHDLDKEVADGRNR